MRAAPITQGPRTQACHAPGRTRMKAAATLVAPWTTNFGMPAVHPTSQRLASLATRLRAPGEEITRAPGAAATPPSHRRPRIAATHPHKHGRVCAPREWCSADRIAAGLPLVTFGPSRCALLGALAAPRPLAPTHTLCAPLPPTRLPSAVNTRPPPAPLQEAAQLYQHPQPTSAPAAPAAAPPPPPVAPATPTAPPAPAPAAAGGAAAEVHVEFRVQFRCGFGASVRVCGDAPALGGWRPDGAPQMVWGDGDNWSATVRLPAG